MVACIEPNTSKYGLPFPQELEELLKIDLEGKKHFESLTYGKIRTLLHIVGKPKSVEVRIKKALTTINCIKEVNGKLNFKELNESFKASNR